MLPNRLGLAVSSAACPVVAMQSALHATLLHWLSAMHLSFMCCQGAAGSLQLSALRPVRKWETLTIWWMHQQTVSMYCLPCSGDTIVAKLAEEFKPKFVVFMVSAVASTKGSPVAASGVADQCLELYQW